MFKLFLFIIPIICSIHSCTKEIDLELPEREPKIIVHGYLAPNAQVEVKLGMSIPYTSNNVTQEITNAEVLLDDQSGQTYELVYNDSLDAFVADEHITILPGNNYELIVDVPSYNSIYAETKVPSKVEIDSISHYPVTSNFQALERYEITFFDPPNANNYYFFYTIGGGNYNHFYSDDPLLQWNSVQKDYIVFSDETIDGQSYTIILDHFFNSEDSVSFYLQTLSPDMYYYFKSIDIQHNLNDFPLENVELNIPIAQPMQVYTNMENAIGIFGAYNSEVKTLPTPN